MSKVIAVDRQSDSPQSSRNRESGFGGAKGIRRSKKLYITDLGSAHFVGNVDSVTTINSGGGQRIRRPSRTISIIFLGPSRAIISRLKNPNFVIKVSCC